MQQLQSYSSQITKPLQLNYLLYLPTDYKPESSQRWPLIMFLHGVGERGDSMSDLERVKAHGLPRYLNVGHDLPCIVVSPQCPSDKWWTLEEDALKGLLYQVSAQYPVDPSRVYLTGLSMGGFGTWSLAIAYPELFAAIAPVSGGGVPPLARLLKDVPVWAIHGALDDVVPLHQSESMVSVLKAVGGNVRFSVFPELKHDMWMVSYNDPELYEWLFSHQKQNRVESVG